MSLYANIYLSSHFFCYSSPRFDAPHWCICDERKDHFTLFVYELILKQLLTIFKIMILLLVVISGWVVLSGKTSVKDPYANFRDAFGGSSHSGNDVCYRSSSQVSFNTDVTTDSMLQRCSKYFSPMLAGLMSIMSLTMSAIRCALSKLQVRSALVSVLYYIYLRIFRILLWLQR